MIIPPSIAYCGLTIVLNKPSRFDDISKGQLLSGWAGQQFDHFLNPYSRAECEIRLSDDSSPLREGTKLVLLLGEESLSWAGLKVEASLDELRGYCRTIFSMKVGNIPTIATYTPQDAYDRKDYESGDDINEDNNIGGSDTDLKGHGKTKRRNWKWWLMVDLVKVKNILRYGVEFYKPEYEVPRRIIRPDLNKVIEALDYAIAEVFNPVLFLDIETDRYLNITCIGLKLGHANTVWVVPIKWYDNSLAYDPKLIYRFFQSLAKLMSIATCVTHNGMFDYLVLALRYKIPFPHKTFDTMLAWNRCYPELEKSLGHLISYFLFTRYHKNDGVYEPHNHQQMQDLMEYNATDIVTMAELYPKLIKELDYCHSRESAVFACSMMRPYLTAQFQGMKLDVDKFVKVFNDTFKKRLLYDRVLNVVAKQYINPRSPKQVTEYLYTTLGLACPDENAPTNEKTLLKLQVDYKKKTGRDHIPSVRLILASRECGKQSSSMKFNLWGGRKFITRLPEEKNVFNRLTTAYNLAGPDTFRLSSRAMLKFKSNPYNPKGWGTNVQNWDKSQRKLVIADEGKIFVQIDQAGAEALIVAYLCRNGKFRELFINGVKPHVFVALHLFADIWKKKFTPDEINGLLTLRPRDLKLAPNFKQVEQAIKDSDNWPDKERYYFIAKMVCHASNYGMKAPTFLLNVLQKSKGAIVLTLAEARNFLDMYHALFPEIGEWHREVQMKLDKSKIMYNLFNEPRLFLEPKGDTLFKQAYAFTPQSTVGQITNRAFVGGQGYVESDAFTDMGLDMLQNNHDSILYQVWKNEDVIRRSIILMMPLMTPHLKYNGVDFQMKAEAQVGLNWGPYKSGENEVGLKEYKIIYG